MFMIRWQSCTTPSKNNTMAYEGSIKKGKNNNVYDLRIAVKKLQVDVELFTVSPLHNLESLSEN